MSEHLIVKNVEKYMWFICLAKDSNINFLFIFIKFKMSV